MTTYLNIVELACCGFVLHYKGLRAVAELARFGYVFSSGFTYDRVTRCADSFSF